MHYISAFHLRKFGFETIDNPKTKKKRKKGIRVYTLNKEAIRNKKCIIERRKPDTLCKIYKYNTQEQETLLSKLENTCSVSIDAIINKNFNLEDIINIKTLIAFFYSNTPNKRRQISNPLEILTQGPFSDEKLKEIESLIGGPFEEGIKRKAHASAALSTQLLSQLITSDYHLVHISEKENEEFVTSDRPVCTIKISQENGFSSHEGWEYSNTDGSISVPKNVNEIIIPQDMIFYFPINPKTAIFLYRKTKENQYIPNFNNYIQEVNLTQFSHSDKYVISQNETTLEQLYNEINALTS